MPAPEYKDLIIKQVAEGIPVLECNGTYIALDLTDAEFTVTKPEEGYNNWEATVTIGDFTLTCTADVYVDGNTKTISNIQYSADID